MVSILLLFSFITVIAGQTVKISDQSFPVERATNLQYVTWRWPKASAIYCVGDTTVSQLRFSCSDCNATSSQAEADLMADLSKHEDQSAAAGYPVIRIQNFRVDPLVNGKTLRCEAQTSVQRNANVQQPVNIQIQPASGRQNGRFSADQPADTSNVVKTEAQIKILYLNNPKIVNSAGRLPMFSKDEGNKFVLKDTETQQLRCISEGNPQPSKYVWTQDGANFDDSQSITVSSKSHMGASILCTVFSDEFRDGMSSPAVRIVMAATPRLNRTNFSQQQKPTGMDQNGKVQLKNSVQLECSWLGSPAPEVRFIRQMGQTLENATCLEGDNIYVGNTQTIMVQPPLYQAYIVQAKCTVVANNYSASGQYICQGCQKLDDGPADCTPKSTQIGSNYITLDVIGGPLPADIQPPPTNQTSEGIWIRAWYCADPQPTEIYWQIGSLKLPVGKADENYKALQPKLNGTTTDCYEATLVINPVKSDTNSLSYVLNVKNTYGTMQTPFKAYVEQVPVEKSSVNVGLAVGLSIGLLVLAVIVGLCVCWFFGLFCCASFGRNTPKTKVYRTNVPPGLSEVKPTPVPNQSRPEPLPRQSPPRGPPVTRIPAPNGHNDSFGNSSVHSEGYAYTVTDSSYIPSYKPDTERLHHNRLGPKSGQQSSSGSEAFEPSEYANLIAQTYQNRFATRSPTSV